MSVGPLELVGIVHSVIVLVSGESLAILLALCSAKYMLLESESSAMSVGPLELVGIVHSVMVLVSGESLAILLALCSAKYMLPEKSEVRL